MGATQFRTSTSVALTVFLVHQDLEGVHLVVLKGLSDLLTHLLVRQLSVHEAAGENTVLPVQPSAVTGVTPAGA